MSYNRRVAEEVLEAGCELIRSKHLSVIPPGVNIELTVTSIRFARLRKVNQLRILVDLHGRDSEETQMRRLVESLY